MLEAPARLETARLLGERIRSSDLPDFQSYYGDRKVVERLDPGGDPWAPEAVEELLDGHLAHWNEHGFGTWVFRDPESRDFAGRAGLRRVEIDGSAEVELFYGVASALWGKGYATEMALRIVKTAFAELGLTGLVAFTLPTNHASRRVLEKCGFAGSGEITHAGLRHLLFRCPQATWASQLVD